MNRYQRIGKAVGILLLLMLAAFLLIQYFLSAPPPDIGQRPYSDLHVAVFSVRG